LLPETELGELERHAHLQSITEFNHGHKFGQVPSEELGCIGSECVHDWAFWKRSSAYQWGALEEKEE